VGEHATICPVFTASELIMVLSSELSVASIAVPVKWCIYEATELWDDAENIGELARNVNAYTKFGECHIDGMKFEVQVTNGNHDTSRGDKI